MKIIFTKKLIILFIIIYFIITPTVSLMLNNINAGEQQYSFLANSFLKLKTYFIDNTIFLPKAEYLSDVTFYEGKYYWPGGPFPTVILMLFVWLFGLFNLFFFQGYLQIFLIIFILYFCYLLAQRIGFAKYDAMFLTIAFYAASMFIGVAVRPWSWYFAQVVTVFLLLASFVEYYNKKRYWLIGIIFGLTALTRITAGIGIVFFIMEILFFNKENKKIKKLAQLILPFIFIAGLIFPYNYIRFGNVFEQGYSKQIIGRPQHQIDYNENPLVKARNYGMLSAVHIPSNLYYSLLAAPIPIFKDNISHVLKFPFITSNPWGMSIFITSPYLIYLFFLKNKDKLSYLLFITAISIAIPIFMYYGIGYVSFGYRYGLDFFPFLFILFMRNYHYQYGRLSNKLKFLIILSGFINLYLYLGYNYNYLLINNYNLC